MVWMFFLMFLLVPREAVVVVVVVVVQVVKEINDSIKKAGQVFGWHLEVCPDGIFGVTQTSKFTTSSRHRKPMKIYQHVDVKCTMFVWVNIPVALELWFPIILRHDMLVPSRQMMVTSTLSVVPPSALEKSVVDQDITEFQAKLKEQACQFQTHRTS